MNIFVILKVIQLSIMEAVQIKSNVTIMKMISAPMQHMQNGPERIALNGANCAVGTIFKNFNI